MVGLLSFSDSRSHLHQPTLAINPELTAFNFSKIPSITFFLPRTEIRSRIHFLTNYDGGDCEVEDRG